MKPKGAAIADSSFPSLFELAFNLEPGEEGTETDPHPYGVDVPSGDEARLPTGSLS